MDGRGIRRRVELAALLTLCAVLTAGSDFNGCGGGDRAETGGALPTTVDVEGCLVDGDCVSEDVCVAVACVMRECVEVGVAGDEDADGFAPPPCGTDCDDADARRFPMATEICDGLDQDCDLVVDEGAVGIESVIVNHGLEHSRLVAGAPEGFVVLGVEVVAGQARLLGRSLTDVGELGPEVSLVEGLDPDVRALAVDARGADLLIALAAGVAPPQRVVVGRDLSVLEAPTDIGADGDVTALEVLLLQGTEHFLLDLADGRRLLVRSGLATVSLTASAAPPVLASNGALVAATEGAGTVHFFDPVSGADAGSQDLIGGFATGALADGDGAVYAAYRDAFDHAIVRVSPSMTAPPVSAPAGDRADDLALLRLPPHVVVTRSGAGGVSLALLSEDIEMYVASFGVGTVSPIPGAAVGTSAAASPGGVSAVLFDYGAQSVLSRLVCTP